MNNLKYNLENRIQPAMILLVIFAVVFLYAFGSTGSLFAGFFAIFLMIAFIIWGYLNQNE